MSSPVREERKRVIPRSNAMKRSVKPARFKTAGSWNADGQFPHVDQPLVLRDRLALRQQGGDMLGDRLAHVPLGVLDGLPVAETAGQRRTPREIAGVIGFLFDADEAMRRITPA
jgi:hypothetical protein